MLTSSWLPLYLENSKIHTKYVGILYKENHVRNVCKERKQKNYQNWLKNKCTTYKKMLFLTHWGLLFLHFRFPMEKIIYTFVKDHQMCILTNLTLNWPSVVKDEDWNIKVEGWWHKSLLSHCVLCRTLSVRGAKNV
jgi:hypothetical protein